MKLSDFNISKDEFILICNGLDLLLEKGKAPGSFVDVIVKSLGQTENDNPSDIQKLLKAKIKQHKNEQELIYEQVRAIQGKLMLKKKEVEAEEENLMFEKNFLNMIDYKNNGIYIPKNYCDNVGKYIQLSGPIFNEEEGLYEAKYFVFEIRLGEKVFTDLAFDTKHPSYQYLLASEDMGKPVWSVPFPIPEIVLYGKTKNFSHE